MVFMPTWEMWMSNRGINTRRSKVYEAMSVHRSLNREYFAIINQCRLSDTNYILVQPGMALQLVCVKKRRSFRLMTGCSCSGTAQRIFAVFYGKNFGAITACRHTWTTTMILSNNINVIKTTSRADACHYHGGSPGLDSFSIVTITSAVI